MKTKIGQILVSCLVKSYPQNFSVNSVIIDSRVRDDFFSNPDLFFTYIEYEYDFETGIKEKIATHDYGNVNLRMSDFKDNTNTLMVTNMSWAPKLGHNLLSIILLVKKNIEIFLKKAGQPSKIVVDDKVFDLADII